MLIAITVNHFTPREGDCLEKSGCKIFKRPQNTPNGPGLSFLGLVLVLWAFKVGTLYVRSIGLQRYVKQLC